MATAADLRAARAELQKMQADMADDKAFGLFSPALQRRITDTKKAIADLTVEVGKQKDALRELEKQNKQLQREEARTNRIRTFAAAAAVTAYIKVASAIKSLKQAGMENTIEANRQHLAYTVLGREIAAVFTPATQASTNASFAAAKAMQGMTLQGQNFTFVLGSAISGLASFSVAAIALKATGIQFTGVMGSIVKMLPALGLVGGLIGGFGALFLSSEAGARMLESAMKDLVTLANALGDAFDEAFNNPGKFWDDFRLGLLVMGDKVAEMLGSNERAARNFYDKVMVPNVKARGGLDERRAKQKKEQGRNEVHPGMPSFGSIDSFERIQLAAAKVTGGLGVPEKHLAVAQEQLEELKAMNANKHMPTRAKLIAGLAVP